mgnify:CR=1 FL=1
MNFIHGKIDENGVFTAKDKDADLKVPERQLKAAQEADLIGKPIILGIRPEHISDDIDAFTAQLWENLNPDNKISLFVRYTDLETRAYEQRILNKHLEEK